MINNKKIKAIALFAFIIAILGLIVSAQTIYDSITCTNCILDNPTFLNFSFGDTLNNSKVNKSGDIMTGTLKINGAGSNNDFIIANNGEQGFEGGYDSAGDSANFLAYDRPTHTYKTLNFNANRILFSYHGIVRLDVDNVAGIILSDLSDTKTTALCIDSNERVFRSTNATSNYLTC